MAAIARIARRMRRSESGAELIEFAVALPILILVIAGIIDFAVLFMRYEVVTNAAREGARVGLLPDYDTPDVQNRVAQYLVASGLTAAVPTTTVTHEQIEVTPGGASIGVVRVVVQYPHEFLFLGPAAAMIGGGPHGDVTLAASSSMRQEIAAAP